MLGRTLFEAHHYIGVYGSARAWLVAQLAAGHERLLVVTRDSKSADELYEDLELFVGPSLLLRLEAWDTLPFENISPEVDVSATRVATLSALHSRASYICVTSIEGLMQRTLPISIFGELGFTLRVGDEIPREQLLHRLEACGFQPVSLVEGVGEIAIRGSVVDIFPSARENPIRVEFFDRRIESIRIFDADSQRSTGSLETVELLPVRELAPFADLETGLDTTDAALERVKQRAHQLEVPARELSVALEALKNNRHVPGLELLQAIARQDSRDLMEHLPQGVRIVLDDALEIRHRAEVWWDQLRDRHDRLAAEHQLVPEVTHLYSEPGPILEECARRRPTFVNSLHVLDEHDRRDVVNIKSASHVELTTKLRTGIGTGDALRPLKDRVKRWRAKGFKVAFVVGSDQRAERLQHTLLNLGFDAPVTRGTARQWIDAPTSPPVAILIGHLHQGFELADQQLAFVAEHEVFHERSYRKRGPQSVNIKRLLSSLAQLSEGDFIVHGDYGIGLYRGLKHMEVEDAGGDFLHLEYADSHLYLPVANIGRIQKFTASEGQTPALDKLSTSKWAQTRQKVRESVEALAGDLIKLYATRSVSQGWRFEPKGAEDERFADTFPFEETPDQLKAIEETLKDMADAKPMDRLVCGDVGFGKTEVAIRATFKCTQHGRQAAVLAPTTILAEQHRLNFEARFQEYPVRVEALSRFNSSAKNTEILKALAAGEIDVIIGTHRLLQRDVAFKDLGLVIIDEEHRFGVKQKEALKQLKRHVDVLSLTATPIPRTLHMSLLGLRDISVIGTPPRDRKQVRTYVATYTDALVRDAVLREIQRGGQCFFLHNRVQTIAVVTEKLRALIPEATVEFSHGQMSEQELERIMRRFQAGEIQLLVTTTIIESGIDMPNANTVLIDRADTYGLAQLYQLRGRVGRSNRQAYAYLLVPRTNRLGSEAQKRLKVLQALDDLGQGFHLAIRDLEIRGAGNLLGKEQSGSVLSVGFDLYTKILREAVLHLKGEEAPLEDVVDPDIKVAGLSAFIPDFYIPDVHERLIMYQRLAGATDPVEIEGLSAEMIDRFGPFGEDVVNLVDLMRLRAILRQFGASRLEFGPQRLILNFVPQAPIDTQKMVRLVQSKRDVYRLSSSFGFSVRHSLPFPCSGPELIDFTLGLLRGIGKEKP